MKRRHFLAAAVAISATALIFRPRSEARIEPLAIDPDQREFVYADGWIVEAQR
ncbi:MAG: hypothetical protein MUD06_03530 [Rhodospirillales bacterium]|jgi:hypothetical protein|nr:hypothetical protein [Rhodospirillales bacterium]